MAESSFEQMIIDCVKVKLTDGTVEQLINEKLEQGISKSLDDVFGYGGSAKKLITSKIEETMVPVIEKHDFNQYLIKLDSVLTELINSTSLKDNKVILDNFKTLMNDDVESFGKMPISRVYEEYQNYVSGNIDTSKLEISYDDRPSYYDATTNMEIEENEHGWFGSSCSDYTVKFTCDEDSDMDCEFRLYKYSDGDIHINSDTIPMDICSLRNLSEFEIFIQKLKRNWSKIVLDEMDSCGDGVEIEAEPEPDWN